MSILEHVNADDPREEVRGQNVKAVAYASGVIFQDALLLARSTNVNTAASSYLGGVVNFLCVVFNEEMVRECLQATLDDLPCIYKEMGDAILLQTVDTENPQ